MYKKRWNLGLGTVFSLIVIYFIYLYSKDKGWTILAFFSGWYLIIVGGLIALSLGILLPVLLFSFRFKRKSNSKPKEYIDAEFKVKEQNE